MYIAGPRIPTLPAGLKGWEAKKNKTKVFGTVEEEVSSRLAGFNYGEEVEECFSKRSNDSWGVC